MKVCLKIENSSKKKENKQLRKERNKNGIDGIIMCVCCDY